MTTKKFIRNGWIVTMDDQLGELRRGSIAIEGSTIVAVGVDIEPEAGAEVIDAEGMVVIPGFVDTHKHLWQTALRGLAGDLTLLDYLGDVYRDYFSRYRPRDSWIGTYVGALELIHGGTTSVLDHSDGVVSPEHADASAGAVLAAGIRGVWAYGFSPIEVPGPQPFTSHGDRIADAYRVHDRHFADNNALVRMGVALTEQGILPFEVTEREIEVARSLDATWTSHSHCPPGNAAVTRGAHRLYAGGYLDHRAVLSHCNEFGANEFAMLAEGGAHFASSPNTELALGIARPAPYLNAVLGGVQPTLATDCATCMSSDMFACMRTALIFARHQFNSVSGATFQPLTEQAVSTRDILRWATLEGAKALGLGDVVGSLVPGKAADVVIVDATAINLAPVIDPVTALVLYGHAGNVDTVIINGRVRKRNGVLVDVEVAERRTELLASRDHLCANRHVKSTTTPRPARTGLPTTAMTEEGIK